MVISLSIDRKFHGWLNILWHSAHNARYFHPGHLEQIKVCTSWKLPVFSWLIREHRFADCIEVTLFKCVFLINVLQIHHNQRRNLQYCKSCVSEDPSYQRTQELYFILTIYSSFWIPVFFLLIIEYNISSTLSHWKTLWVWKWAICSLTKCWTSTGNRSIWTA